MVDHGTFANPQEARTALHGAKDAKTSVTNYMQSVLGEGQKLTLQAAVEKVLKDIGDSKLRPPESPAATEAATEAGTEAAAPGLFHRFNPFN